MFENQSQQKWTPEQINFLMENYGKLNAKQISLALKRTEQSIRMKAFVLKINKINYKEWTEAEISLLKNKYPISTVNEIKKFFPDRYYENIKSKAKKLKIKRLQKNKELIQGKCEKLLADSHESFYWMGFLISDGHFSKLNRLTCRISSKDKDHLLRLGSFLETKCNSWINKDNKYEYIGLSIMDSLNVKLIKEKFDLHTNKTENPPSLSLYSSIPDDLFFSLLIGIIDGDGSVKNQTGRKDFSIIIKLHGSWLPFLELINDRVNKTLNIHNPRPIINNCGYARIIFTNIQVHRFLKIKAKEYSLPFMERKLGRINEFKMNKNDIYKQRIEIVKTLLEEGLSVNDISKKLNLSYTSIKRISEI